MDDVVKTIFVIESINRSLTSSLEMMDHENSHYNYIASYFSKLDLSSSFVAQGACLLCGTIMQYSYVIAIINYTVIYS